MPIRYIRVVAKLNGSKILCIDQYRYGKHSGSRGPKGRWICTSVFFVDTGRGTQALCVGQYRYNRHSSSRGPKSRWNCVKAKFGCAFFSTTRYGNPVITVGNYRYNKWSGSRGPHIRWTCVKNQMGCRATITTLENMLDVACIVHDSYHDAVVEAVFTKSRYGKPVIQIGDYRFNKWSGNKGARARWVCAKTCYGCRAKIITVNDEIIQLYNDHNH
ncbi:unnamed protein product [Diatraea saccharalis]|uniref:FLYWCH-type domain-containing protein n=1 Tax=Diatraea saccharalis TaxID=40085 RepID=A0A9N9R0Y7_9NEOP|nr:unnamed protein product [Diatraea saccharalis]